MQAPACVSAVVLAFAWLACAGGPSKQESVTAPGVDLAAYATFGWQPAGDNAGAAGAPLSILDANIRNAIRAQLVERGYREVQSQPDLRIRFETATYVVEKTKNPVRIGVGVGSWGSNVGGGVSTSVPVGPEGVATDQETRLSIRAVDPKTNQEVWVGTATGGIDPASDAGAVEKVVASTMKEFPSRPR